MTRKVSVAPIVIRAIFFVFSAGLGGCSLNAGFDAPVFQLKKEQTSAYLLWRLPMDPHSSTTVRPIAFYPDNKHVLVGGEQGELVVWDMENDMPETHIATPSTYVRNVAVSPDGKFVASVSAAKPIASALSSPVSVQIYNLQEGRATKVAIGDHIDAQVAFSPDSRLLAVLGPELTLREAQSLDVVWRPGSSVGTGNTSFFFFDSGRRLHFVAAEREWSIDGRSLTLQRRLLHQPDALSTSGKFAFYSIGPEFPPEGTPFEYIVRSAAILCTPLDATAQSTYLVIAGQTDSYARQIAFVKGSTENSAGHLVASLRDGDAVVISLSTGRFQSLLPAGVSARSQNENVVVAAAAGNLVAISGTWGACVWKLPDDDADTPHAGDLTSVGKKGTGWTGFN